MPDDDTLRGLLAIILDPASDSDHARLVYADRCEELGLDERAEFIRVQVGIEKALADENDEELPVVFRRDVTGPHLGALRRRERELLGHGRDYEWAFPRGWFTDSCSWVFRRGFVEAVTCTAEDWDRNGDAILKAQPVREVTLTTCPPDVPSLALWEHKWPGVRFRQVSAHDD